MILTVGVRDASPDQQRAGTRALRLVLEYFVARVADEDNLPLEEAKALLFLAFPMKAFVLKPGIDDDDLVNFHDFVEETTGLTASQIYQRIGETQYRDLMQEELEALRPYWKPGATKQAAVAAFLADQPEQSADRFDLDGSYRLSAENLIGKRHARREHMEETIAYCEEAIARLSTPGNDS